VTTTTVLPNFKASGSFFATSMNNVVTIENIVFISVSEKLVERTFLFCYVTILLMLKQT